MNTLKTLLKQAFGQSRRARRLRRQSNRSEISGLDCLEKRLVMAIEVIESPANPDSPADFLSVLVNQGTDCYVQMGVGELRIADNAGFVGAEYIPDVASLTSLGFYSGQMGGRSVSFADDSSRYGLPKDYPSSENLIDSLSFTLPTSQAPDQNSGISGSFDLGDGQGRVQFTNNGSGVPQVTGAASSSYEIVFSPGQVKQRLVLRLTGGGSFPSNVGSVASPDLQIRYSYLIPGTVGQQPRLAGVYVDGTGLTSNLSGENVFTLVDETSHRIAPGTISGEIAVNYQGTNTIRFSSGRGGDGISPLVFGLGRTASHAIGDLRVEGEVNVKTGELTLKTYFAVREGQGNTVQTRLVGQGVSVLLDNVRMGLFDLDGADDGADPFGVTFDGEANKFTLFPGHDLAKGLTVSLRNVGSAIAIQSPLLATVATEKVSLSANQVQISAPVRAAGGFIIPPANEAAFGTITEELRVDAALGAPSFEIALADDEASDAKTRSRFIVTQSGSVSDLVAVNAPRSADLGLADAADTISVDVSGGDIYIEGQVVGLKQSYTMSSGIGSELEGPYFLSTQSPLTAQDTGVIRGDTVVVTLANDTFGENYEAFQSLASSVRLRTDVGRLRVQSGTRAGSSLALPFPYDLTINETDGLMMDAVSASSGGISIKTGGTLDLLGSIQSLGDIALEAGQAFTVATPIATSFGSINISGPTVNVRNSVRVFDGYQDERKTDIQITAEAGDLVIEDAVSAINGIGLTASGDVRGTMRITADIVKVQSTGNVDLATEANFVSVIADGAVAIDESSAAVFEVRESPAVTIVAHGQDRLVPAGVSPALYADIFDTKQLVVSAPAGSIDVLHYGTDDLQIGDENEISASNSGSGTSVASMLAAGSVIIRSTQASKVLVADAPVAASGATEVRFATTAALPARPLSRHTASTNPGIYPTTLVTRLSLDPTDKTVDVLGGVLATDLRLGDRVLVKDGLKNHVDGVTGLVDDALVNGIYVIRAISFLSASEVQVSMARATAFDTTQELDGRRYVRVTDGSSDPTMSLRGRVYVSEGFENREPDVNFATPLRVAAIPSRSGFVDASAVTTSPLDAAYDASSGRITSSDSRSILSDATYFDGVKLSLGSRVLVRHAVDGDAAAIGLYVVTAVGEADKLQWQLARYQGVDEDGSGQNDGFFTGAVAINEGTLRTAVSGLMFEIAYDSVNHAPLRYHELTDFKGIAGDAGETFLTEEFDSSAHYRTDIGMNRSVGEVVYEVTSDAGTNNAAGSLGKMLQILQANAAKVSAGGVVIPQSYSTQINPSVTRINLTQELPLIDYPIDLVYPAPESDPSVPIIDPNDPNLFLASTATTNLIIDGSNILINRDGGVVRSSAIGGRMGPIRPSEASTARRLVRSAGVSGSLAEIHGLEFGPGGTGSVIDNLSIGGFRNGSAIRIAGASEILIKDVNVGLFETVRIESDGSVNESQSLLPNAYGIVVEQAAGGDSGRYTTVLDSKIVANSVAGVSLGTHVDGVRIVGSTIGSDMAGNSVGVLVDTGEIGLAAIGVQRVMPTAAVTGLPITPLSSNTATVARNSLSDVFEEGLQFYERQSNRLWTVAGKAVDSVDGDVYLLTLNGPPLQSGSASSTITIEAGYFANVAARSDSITLPEGVDRNRLYLGQSVSSTVEGALERGTTITSIDEAPGGGTVIGISKPVAITAKSAILFEEPGRNSIARNDYGVVLRSGSSKMFTTDIEQSVFDGIRLDGVASGGSHQIGGASGTILSIEDNVAVHSNGSAGINFAEAFFADLGVAIEPKLRRVSQVIIQGNFLGTNIDQDEGLSNGRDGASNIVFGKTFGADPNADLRFSLIESDARGGTGRYLAWYRPEDNPEQLEELEEIESIDLQGNLHFSGNPVILVPGAGGFNGGGGDGTDDDGWWNYLPTLR